MTKPIKRRKLYEQIAELIQEDIARGIIRPGEQLPSERDIMARYGVGRAAVRAQSSASPSRSTRRIGCGWTSRSSTRGRGTCTPPRGSSKRASCGSA